MEKDPLAPYLASLTAALGYTGGTHTLEDVRKELADGRLQLWSGLTSFILTRLHQQPSGQLDLHIFCAGGDQQEIALMAPFVYQYGRDKGCVRATGLGRKGWERSLFVEDGWRPTMTWFEKEL